VDRSGRNVVVRLRAQGPVTLDGSTLQLGSPVARSWNVELLRP
jgi:hypothetical protein